MTDAPACAMAPPAFVPLIRGVHRMIAARLPRPAVRDIFAAALIVLAASAVVSADERLQDWIPDVLVLPDDAEVVTDRSIGSTVRMFSISTTADAEGLLTDWEERLNSNGFPVTRTADDLLDGSMEFSGPGIANAKIVVAPTTEDGRNVIAFDATLD